MFERFTDRARKVMALANQEAQRFNHEYIGTEHILLGLVKEGSGTGANVLKNLEVDLRKVRLEVEKLVKSGPETVTAGKLPQSPRAKKVIEYAIEEARNLNHNYTGTEHLLLGLLREQDGVGAQVLMNLNLVLEDVREETLNLLGVGDESEGVRSGVGGLRKGKSKTPALDSFGRDLTGIARQGALDPVIGRARELDRVITVLCRRGQNNPVLVGEPGVGRRAIVEGLAQKVVSGDIPELLADCRIVVLDVAMMVAGAKYRGELEERIKTVMNEVRRAGNVILLFDELHTLFGAAGDEGSIAMSNVLRPALSRGETQCIGTATLGDYRKYVLGDTELGRRFQIVFVEPPSSDSTLDILTGLRDRYEAHHRVRITDEALRAAVELSDSFIPDGFFPDKAINLMDEAGARVRLKSMRKPPDLTELERELNELSTEKDEAVKNADYELAAQIRESMDAAKLRRRQMQKEWRDRTQELDGVVDADTVIEALSRLTGVRTEEIRNRDTTSVPQAAGAASKGLPDFERLQCESILHGQQVKITPGFGFVLMPHKQEFRDIFDAVISPAMAANGVEAKIADDISEPGSILNQVWTCIRTAEVIVADVSGCNENVIYELGLCFGLHRLPIILARDPKELPFNLRALRYITYENNASGGNDLKERLTAAIREFLAAARSPRPEI